jgi:hypothetical protein
MSTADTSPAAVGGASREAQSMELTQTLDDAWNPQGIETFAQRKRGDVGGKKDLIAARTRALIARTGARP